MTCPNQRAWLPAIAIAAMACCVSHADVVAQEKRTPIVDMHTHCFAGKASKDFPYHARGPYQPEEPASPELLLERMKQAGVDFALVVHPEPYQDDHRYLEHCLKVGKKNLKGTCLFFADQPDSVERMQELVRRNPNQIVSLRIHAYAQKRLPPFGKPELKRLWKAAGDLGLAVQLNCEPRFAEGFEPLIKEFPKTLVIIDHLGLPYSNKLEQHAVIMKWARFPNTVMKISGLPDRKKHPDRDVAPILRAMIREFTPRRLIYGGGFNDTPSSDAYRAHREEIRAHFAHLFASDQDLIFGGNAVRLFGFAPDTSATGQLIGYTEFRTNLPGGRHANVRTMRATLVNVDGSGRRLIAEQLANQPDAWTQFAGWSPDGKTAVVSRGWQSPENARWEEENKTFRFTKDGWLLDSYLIDLAKSTATNVTAVERVSFYNGGLFFWPGDSTKLGFTALINGNSHPFRMDRDGRNKVDLTKASKEFAYGFSSSRDGKRIAYHKNYQVYLADADGSNVVHIKTGKSFNFVPSWSPDGKWVLFLSGEHYNCHPHLVRADGTDLKKLADRGGYKGVIEFLDVYDFHQGSSDVPVWATDGKSIYFTAKIGKCVELFQATLEGKLTQLTKSPDGTLHYHPQPSPDGKRLAYGSKRDGVRQLYVMDLADRTETRLTNLKAGHAAMWLHWQPATGKKD